MAAFLALWSAALLGQPEAEELELEAHRGDRLIIRNNAGFVRVGVWGRDAVRVRYFSHVPEEDADSLQLLFVRHRQRLQLHTYWLDGPGGYVDMEVRLPAYLDVTARGVAADISVSDVEGRVKVETLRGRIHLKDLPSQSVSAFTRAGSVRFQSEVQPSGKVRLASHFGDIELDLGAELALEVQASTQGRITWNGYPSAFSRLDRELGEGDRRELEATAFEGDIEIRRGEAARLDPPRWNSRTPLVRLASNQREFNGSPPLLRRKATPAGRPAESPGEPSSADFQVAVEQVRLNAIVRSRRDGRLIPSLERDDFRVYQDGLEQPIANFLSGEAPFHLLLLLDVSGSTQNYIKLLRKATLGFIDRLRPEDRIAVGIFSLKPILVQDFTDERGRLEKAVKQIDHQGPTNLYESFFAALKKLEEVEGRKALVVFSDGVDDSLQGTYQSSPDRTYAELYRAALESDSIVYTIFLDTEDFYGSALDADGMVIAEMAYREARRQLKRIAEQTGGQLFSARDSKRLGSVYKQIAEELRSLYTLSYRPPQPRAQQWKVIDVRIRGRASLVVRHRKGYY